MEINSVGSSHINNSHLIKNKKSKNPNFTGLMDVPGTAMQWLEKSGFIGSFLVQDTLGMTVPRTREGLYRDVPQEKKKNLKDLNYKEGAEVLIREALSGPLMMFTPVAVLILGKKFIGKSTFTNSSMIKRLGNTLTNVVKNGSHDSAKALKKDFYTQNVTAMVQNTTKATDKVAESKFIEKAVGKLELLDNYSEKIANASGKRKKLYKKAQQRSQQQLVDMFNDFHKTHSTDYSMVNKVKLDAESGFATDKTIEGMRSYVADALKNKNVADVTEEYTKNLQRKSLISRGIVNALAAASTIGSVSIVPLLYKLVNPVPPGALANNAQNSAAKTPAQTKTVDVKSQNPNQVQVQQNKNNGNVSFTGKLDRFAKHFEFNGNQLTPALMTSLATVGLIGPRVNTAVKRAPEDPVTKKKDYSEVPEVLTRDIISTGAVTFGVPMLSKAIVSSYENYSGFVLQNKADKPMTTMKKVLDKLNPFSGLNPYSLNDLNNIYGDINSHKKLGTFAEFVKGNNGSLAKIFNTLDNGKELFNEVGLDIKELAKSKDRAAANNTIIEKMTTNKEFADKLIEAMKPAKKGGANNILKRARSLNSYTTFAATFFLVPAFLGIILPKMVYGLTAKRREQMAQAQDVVQQNVQPQTAAAPVNNTQTVENTEKNSTIDFSKLKSATVSQTFGKIKHS